MRKTLFLLLAVGATIVAPSIAYAQTEPNLTGEVFTEGVTAPTIFNKTCHPDGTSTWNYTFSGGVALGPFPGVVSETGLVELDPLIGPSPEIPFGFFAGTVITLDATYQVEGPLGTVNGIKELQVVVPENLGTCIDGPFLTPVPGSELCPTATYVQAQAGRLAYFAQIDPITGGTFFDEGESAVEMTGLTCGVVPLDGSLDETYVSNKAASTPGEARGGGMIELVPGQPGITFAFGAKSDLLAGPSGHCTVVTHKTVDVPTRTKVKCLDVTSYTQVLNHVHFTGNAEVDGVATTYRIDVTDNGDDGDTFAIQTDGGFTAGGVVTHGGVRVE